ncbi:MAG TPA: type II toxin-antitoxin system antitoxin SocA domain-containing protein [Candidatus Angelobacter sp.]|nr:type II toxin-antitoxin system antitoxin SocA domain-containing protein [Candidatus Angelobacter sp.]
MVSVKDVAAYILKKRGSMTAMKLQKLVYYAQAWSLVWDDKPLFGESIEAWINGPVVRELYEIHRGQFRVTECPLGDPKALHKYQKETVDSILKFYGKMPSQQLSDLTHREDPWKNARRGLDSGERGTRIITHDAMAEYYSGL